MSDRQLSGVNAMTVSDEIRVEIDGMDATHGRRLPPVPADDAPTEVWRAYAVGLGLDAAMADRWDKRRLMLWAS